MQNIKLKTVFAGHKSLYDVKTGEEILVPQFKKRVVSSNFTQKFLPKKGVFMLVPKSFSAADRQVLDYFEIVMDDRNLAHEPAVQISARLQLAVPTIYNCIKALRDNDFMKKKSNSYYMINPNYAVKCSAAMRSELEQEYYETIDTQGR